MRYLILILIFLSVSTRAESAASSSRYDFRFNPLGLFVGTLEADLNVAINDNWTLGPQLGFLHFRVGKDPGFNTDYDVKGYMLGLRANWFRNGTFTDGLYIGPSVKWAGVKVETSDSVGPVTKSASSTILSCLVGYGWFWDGFNIMLGGGLNLGLGDNDVTITNSSGQTAKVATHVSGLATEFALGWTF